jgi:hypothetical protein
VWNKTGSVRVVHLHRTLNLLQHGCRAWLSESVLFVFLFNIYFLFQQHLTAYGTKFSVVLFISHPLHVSVIRLSSNGNTHHGKTYPSNGSTVIGTFVLLANLYLYRVESSLVGIGYLNVECKNCGISGSLFGVSSILRQRHSHTLSLYTQQDTKR